jgi:flavin reductase (DIM6/NTAB) family NADH-FMN oxidoreductase RutF
MSVEKELQQALRRLQYGVYVVTMGAGEDGNAFTASWVSQVSSEPPMVAVAIHNKHQSARLLKQLDSFVINLLPAGDVAVAKTYYGPAESGYEKLRAKDISDSPVTGTPVLKGVVGFLEARIAQRVPAGNHTVFIGEVVGGKLHTDADILSTTNCPLHYTG